MKEEDATPKAAIVTISYEDLKNFDGNSLNSPENAALINDIGRAFGSSPECFGLIAVNGIPYFQALREDMLRLAFELAHLDEAELEKCERPDAMYSVGWSCGREQLAAGKPDLAKGSYYANPLTDSLIQSLMERYPDRIDHLIQQRLDHPEFFADNIWPEKLPLFRKAFMDLGKLMHETGVMVAAVCDAYCLQYGVDLGLHKMLKKSLNAKGRLLHYFPIRENSGARDSWCAWHNDHGSLTALAPGMYLDKHRAQLENPDPEYSGLFIKARSGKIYRAVLPKSCCGFQIGETSQIQSGGLLRATPHAVRAPRESLGVDTTRESFALFMEPEFDEPLTLPIGKTVQDCQGDQTHLPHSVMPLSKRWKPGSTFGDFHLATVTGFATD